MVRVLLVCDYKARVLSGAQLWRGFVI